MLQQEPQTEKTPSPAQIRVTPEELAKALAAVEARKEQSARETEGTIPIGEAVQQLGFDATPEEVWAEVQAQRAQGNHRPKSRRRRLIGGVLLTALIGTAAITTRHSHSTASRHLAMLSAQPAPLSAPPTIAVLAGTGTNGQLETLAEVPENRPVQATMCSCGSEFTGYESYLGPWTLIKHNGKIYVRGWITPMTEQVMKTTGNVKIVNNNGRYETGPETGPEGLHDVHVTLALSNFKRVPNPNPNAGDDPFTYDQFEMTDVHLDKHAWEKW